MLVGGSAAGVAVRVAEENPLKQPIEWSGGRELVRDDKGCLFCLFHTRARLQHYVNRLVQELTHARGLGELVERSLRQFAQETLR